jgi:glycosyltransferase involved in cell wall biosynthesis
MKVLIVNNVAPFIWGGAEELAANLQKQLTIFGHDAEILKIPFRWEPAEGVASQMLMVRAFELTNVDHVIALKFPAYLIRHPRKTLWLLHQYRQAYDLFDAGQSSISYGSDGDSIRAVIRNADGDAFEESRRIFTNSEVTRGRLKHYNGFNAEVLLPPLNNPELFFGQKSEGYIFAGGRVNSMKRQHLLVEAMQYLPVGIKLVVAGPPDSLGDAQRLLELVEKYDLSDRVKLDLRFMDREVLANYVNGALACAYIPFDEDSLGYVAMEAATAGKPVITASDSGGVLGLVKDGETGWVAVPEPKALAESMAIAHRQPEHTRMMGESTRALWESFGATWENTIKRLLE